MIRLPSILFSLSSVRGWEGGRVARSLATPWNWSYGQLWAAMRVLESNSGPLYEQVLIKPSQLWSPLSFSEGFLYSRASSWTQSTCVLARLAASSAGVFKGAWWGWAWVCCKSLEQAVLTGDTEGKCLLLSSSMLPPSLHTLPKRKRSLVEIISVTDCRSWEKVGIDQHSFPANPFLSLPFLFSFLLCSYFAQFLSSLIECELHGCSPVQIPDP